MNSEAQLAGLRTQIEQGAYQVDPKAVADAIVQRLLALAEGRGQAPAR